MDGRWAGYGWRVPGYLELKELGEGAQGRVVLAEAEDRTPGGTDLVAIKYLRRDRLGDERSTWRFRAEAATLARLDDPHVARLHQYVENAEGAAIVMEAVNGVSLRRLLDQSGALAPEAALTVLKGSLLGLAAAHAIGIVHRDYKPSNVIVSAQGLSKLVDFGVAALAGESGRSGTPAYMSPEQWLGDPASPMTDVYAATCVFFECVTGSRPFPGSGAHEVMGAHLTAPAPVEAVHERLRFLVARGMAKEPIQRPPGAAAFVVELEAIASSAYGPDGELRGIQELAIAAAALSMLFPLAALAYRPVSAATDLAQTPTGDAASPEPGQARGGAPRRRGRTVRGGRAGAAAGAQRAGTRAGRRSATKVACAVALLLTLSLTAAVLGLRRDGHTPPPSAAALPAPRPFATVTSPSGTPPVRPSAGRPSLNPNSNPSPNPGPSGSLPGAGGRNVPSPAYRRPGTTGVTVPDLIGYSAEDAAAELSGLGLGSTVEYRETDDGTGVIETEPSGGATVPAGTTITLYVATAPDDTVQVPDVVGLCENQAVQLLQEHGLSANPIDSDDDAGEPADGEVTSADPEPGTSVEPGTTVTLMVYDAGGEPVHGSCYD